MGKNKFKEITIMNAFLCFCVVMIHLTSSPVATLTHASFWHIIIFIINKALCFSVPSFIFLSGFKLYNSYDGRKIDIKRFYMGRFKKIVIPYIICVLIYFAYFLSKRWVNIYDLPQYIFLGTLAAHFYYIIIAVQLYLIFPLLNKIFNKNAILIVLLSLICTAVCHEIFKFRYFDRFFGTYIFYFVLGMLFAKYRIYEKINKIYVAGIVGFVITAIIHLTLSYMALSGKIIYRYAEIVNMVYVTFSIIVMYSSFIKLGKNNVIYKFADIISNSSYNIYLYHIMIIFILQYDIFPRFDLSIRNEFAISFFVVYSLIILYSFLQKRIKK